jgi:hypothetical protein
LLGLVAWVGCLVAWLLGCLVAWLLGCLVALLLECLAAWLLECLAAWLLGLLNCLVAWLLGCLVAWLLDWLVAWLLGRLVDWLLGCLVAWFCSWFGCLVAWLLVAFGCLTTWLLDCLVASWLLGLATMETTPHPETCHTSSKISQGSYAVLQCCAVWRHSSSVHTSFHLIKNCSTGHLTIEGRRCFFLGDEVVKVVTAPLLGQVGFVWAGEVLLEQDLLRIAKQFCSRWIFGSLVCAAFRIFLLVPSQKLPVHELERF